MKKHLINIIIALVLVLGMLLLPSFSTKSSNVGCVMVDTVYVNSKMKSIGTRNVLFGIKQIAEEKLSEKYDVCNTGEPVSIELAYIGVPKKTIRVAGVGKTTQTTEVLMFIYFKGQKYEGTGSEDTEARAMFIELKDNKVPFNQMTLSTAIKKAIEDGVSKMP
jgi:hypothetical protein